MAFIQTIECGSFTRAAELLNYSQSGISRMIGDLEKDWRVSLLVRNRTGVTLTSEGMRLLPYARSVCEEYRKLQMQVEELNGLQSGLIRIGTISSIAAHWLPNVIAAFQKEYPNVAYELLLGHYADIEAWVNEGRVDVGFTRLPAQTDLEGRLFGTGASARCPAGAASACALQPVSGLALADYPLMLLGKGEKADISEIFERCGITPNIHFTTVDDYAVMSMVEKGLGISILPELILKRTPYHIVIKELDVPAYRSLGFVMKDKKHASLAAKRFLEYLGCRTL